MGLVVALVDRLVSFIHLPPKEVQCHTHDFGMVRRLFKAMYTNYAVGQMVIHQVVRPHEMGREERENIHFVIRL